MREVSLYDETELARLLAVQKSHNWDLEESIDWSMGINLNKPLVPLDQDALFFPGASSEERLAISQMMGLVIAASICEMEEALNRLRKQCWSNAVRQYPVSPEFNELGEQFFEEEVKHSKAFRRYLEKFAHDTGIDLNDLLKILPIVENTTTENFLKKNLERGGYAFWWIVAEVEQEFLLLYNALAPFKELVDPLYLILHRKHFEEESLHAPFPYLMLELFMTRQKGLKKIFHAKSDLAISQIFQVLWTGRSLQKMKKLKKLKACHPLFEALDHAYPLLENQPLHRTIWKFLTSTPYVSSLVNPGHHNKFLKFTKKMGSPSLPFPSPKPSALVEH